MKIAVIGSGVSGLAATWLLNEHSDHEVHLFEKDDRPGGHANTARFHKAGANDLKDGVNVDTAFLVFNEITYPNLCRFLSRYPHLEYVASPMSFSVSRDHGAFEWASDSLSTLFCQPLRVFDPNMWRMMYDIIRFNACTRSQVEKWKTTSWEEDDISEDLSIGDYLEREGYSESFRDNYLIPMTAAIWSTPPDLCAMDFPLRTYLLFMDNHHMLQITGRPVWLSFKDGSRSYVDEIIKKLNPSNLHLSTPISSVTTSPKPTIVLHNGTRQEFDHVIMACHTDVVLSLLRAGGGATDEEEEVLGSFRWTQNEIVLHSDMKLMPRASRARAAWNYLTTSVLDEEGKKKANTNLISVTFDMNKVQSIPRERYGNVLITENPPFPPDPETVVGRWVYDHPVLDAACTRAQRRLPSIQGKRGISFAGAYQNWGFHEDGFTSGVLAVTQNILSGVLLPFKIELMEGSSWGGTEGGMMRKRGDERLVQILAVICKVLEGLGIRAIIGRIFGSLLGVISWILVCFGIQV